MPSPRRREYDRQQPRIEVGAGWAALELPDERPAHSALARTAREQAFFVRDRTTMTPEQCEETNWAASPSA